MFDDFLLCKFLFIFLILLSIFLSYYSPLSLSFHIYLSKHSINKIVIKKTNIMFSPLSYSYVANDEYDTRKLKKKNKKKQDIKFF